MKSIFDNILLDRGNLKYSIILLLMIIIFGLIYNRYIRPSFVIPNKYKFTFFEILYKFLIYLGIFVLILLPLNPQYILWKYIKKEKSLNVQFLFDVSLSMTAKDIKPYRFEAAKQTLIDLVESLNWYNISVIFFSWIPFIGIPFSDENLAVAERLREINLGDFPPTINFVWTAIWDAILLGIANLKKFAINKEKPWIIVLITDWDSNKWSDPIDAAKVAANYGIPVYVLAIWRSDYIVWKDYFWLDVPTTINVKLLKKIADISGWKFYRILTNKDFDRFKKDLFDIVRTEDIVKVYYEKLNLVKYMLIYLIFVLFIQILYKSFIFLKIYKLWK